MTINCDLCNEEICKYELDFNSNKGIMITPKDETKYICHECAVMIAMELIK